jgi:hypothetical protein
MADKYDLTNLSIDEIPAVTPAGTTDYAVFYDASAGRFGKALVGFDFSAVTATAAEVNRVADVSGRLVAAGSSLTLTEAAHDGKTILLDTAAGSTVTLPAASGSGARFRFVIKTVATSNSHIIKVANASDAINGIIYTLSDDTAAVKGFAAAATDDTITLNRTTTGSVSKGEFIEIEDIATNVFAVRGFTQSTGTEATPFSATV